MAFNESKPNSPEAIPLSNVYPNRDRQNETFSPQGSSFQPITRTVTTDSFMPDDDSQLPTRRFSAISNGDLEAGPNEPLPQPRLTTNYSSQDYSYSGAYSPNSATSLPYAETEIHRSTSNLTASHAYGSNDSQLRGSRSRGHNSEQNDKSRLLTVPEEETSDSSDDDDQFLEIKDIVGNLNSKKLSEDLKKEKENNSEPTTGESTPRRRGLRHYKRKEKSKKKKSRSARVAEHLRNAVLYLMQISIVARCFFFWIPLAVILFIPLAIGAWVKPATKVGRTPLVWFMIWLEIVWGALWVSRLVASVVPLLFRFFASILAPNLKKYRAVLTAMEVPITLLFWAIISLSTFMPVITQKDNASESDATESWQRTVNSILVGFLISSLIYFAERLLIHLISVSFHRTRFARRIKDNKASIKTLSDMLYVACVPFPPFCPEFAEEDLQLQGGTFLKGKKAKDAGLAHKLASSHNLQRFFGRVNHALDVAAVTLGKVARGDALDTDELQNWVSSTIADAMNSETLAEVLAKRIWMSLVLEGEEHLTIDDLVEVLGEPRRTEAENIFRVLDIDGNGNLTLEEMISAVVEICHERRSVYKSLRDVDSAIGKLHKVLMFIVGIIIIIVFIGLLAPSVSAVLATMGTTVLALSFVFSTTAQEITASCVFLFVKHPIDVGDRVDIQIGSTVCPFFVREISLLYTVFTRVLDDAVVQAPNSVLNTLWIENISRSGPMQYGFTLRLGLPETSFDQIDTFKAFLNQFCLDNSRDYQANPYVFCTEMPDLDRVKLHCSVMFRSNFADGKLYSQRRNKLLQFVGRTIHDLGITIPRREDTATDPGLPWHLSGSMPSLAGPSEGPKFPTEGPASVQKAKPADVSNELLDIVSRERSHAKLFNRPRALMGFGPSGTELIELRESQEQTVVEAETVSDVFRDGESEVISSADHARRGSISQGGASGLYRNVSVASRTSALSRSTTTGRRRRV